MKTIAAISLVLAFPVFAQNKAEKPPAAIAMPADRKAESYVIYSSLMPLGETAGKDWPHQLWIVQDTTVDVIPADEPCAPASPSKDDPRMMTMNPHVAVRPSADHAQDFAEILEDWDSHCHDRVLLDRDGWHTSVPVLLLDSKAQGEYAKSRFQANVSGEPKPYEGAPSLYGFSLVYFNKAHTVALVYATHYCGTLCAEGFWVALAFENGSWKRLNWDSSRWVS